MAKISREEIIKIAQMSHVDIHADEIPGLLKQLQDVLSYAERVQEGAADVKEPAIKNVNFFREDVVVRTEAALLLARAPQEEENYFVVPAILENKKKA